MYSWNDFEHFYDNANPFEQKSIINTIHNRSNQIREEDIANEIQKAMNDGKDVFAIYGDGHAYTLEPALRKLAQ